MSEKKIYTAFISSAFQSLRDERNSTIDTLLDFRIMPIAMEHFTVSSSGKFTDIEELIDESDFFVMLLGDTYGSCNSEGLSWTECEYIYAVKKHKPIVAIICQELARLQRCDPATLTEDQRKQVAFARRVEFARAVSEDFSIKTILVQFFNTIDFAKCAGWIKQQAVGHDPEALERWQQEHRVFDLSGNWYHVHLSEDDETYIRTGTVKIEQEFTPENYLDLHMEGANFSVLYYRRDNETLYEDKMKSSRFVGEYKMQENGEIFGIFNSKRAFKGSFDSKDVNRGTRRGIHDFCIDVFAPTTERIDGEFHDEAPSPKLGRLFLFRDVQERNQFLLDTREDVIEFR